MVPDVVSLGMLILDENVYPESWNRSKEENIVGGAGPYAIVGARMAGGPHHSVSGIIDRGSDFPESVQQQIDSWDTDVVFRTDGSRKTTRGRNIYDENHVRTFEYLNPKKRIELEDLLDNQSLLQSKSFHVICSITRCRELVEGIRHHNEKSQFIYEPLPSDCVAANYQELLDLLPMIEIFTPNLNEACEFLGRDFTESLDDISDILDIYIEAGARYCVLRCGPLGCMVGSRAGKFHIPAYHHDQLAVVDVTGGGNSFCGAFMMGWLMLEDLVVAGICGNLVSGCVIERLGMPLKEGSNWNGKSMADRWELYRETLEQESWFGKEISEKMGECVDKW